MLLCKACNTRFADGMPACPSCGRRAAEHAVDAAASSMDKSVPTSFPLSEPADDGEIEVDLELDEVAVVDDPGATPVAARRRQRPKPVPSARRLREPGPTVLNLDPAQVRILVTEQPGLLEKGLEIYADENGDSVGIDFPTPVGPIDLLARDKSGAVVVVAVPDPADAADIVPDVVQRIGYVRKHVAGGRSAVRGIVVLDRIPEEVAYAAAGMAGTVSFKAFRVALTFQDLDV
jgi:hypothetical protein